MTSRRSQKTKGQVWGSHSGPGSPLFPLQWPVLIQPTLPVPGLGGDLG